MPAMIPWLALCVSAVIAKPPNIVMIVADDLGWGDVGWTNNNMLDVTPTLTSLAMGGVILDQYYVQQVCTPSRSALMTGMYPYHIGRQKGTIKPLQPTGLTLNTTTLPQHLARLGYTNHVVGKWHLGFCRWEFTPTFRGFHNFYGYYTGAEDYFLHQRSNFYDFRSDMSVNYEAKGSYSTDLFTAQAVNIIREHNYSSPLFLYLPYQAVHAPLEAPRAEYEHHGVGGVAARDIYRAMLARLDSGVGKIVRSLQDGGVWGNTLLVFTTDNGGAVSQAGSNHPLRGTKGTLFEGGTHGVAFVGGGAVQQAGVRSDALMHISDWYPTLLSAAGHREPVAGLDGVDQWEVIKTGVPTNRTELVYNLKMIPPQGAIRVGQYKLMFANKFHKDGWYDIDRVKVDAVTNKIKILKKMHKKVSLKHPKYAEEIFDIRSEDEDNEFDDEYEDMLEDIVNEDNDANGTPIQRLFDRRWPKLKKHLFNVVEDPEERTDLQESRPDLMEELRLRVREYLGSFVARDYPDTDKRGNPRNFGGVWSPGWC